MNKQILFASSALLIAGLTTITSCKKDDNNTVIQPYTVPATYTFDNSNYTEATTRVKMMTSLDAYMKTATSAVLDQTKATNMFNNTNSPFGDATLDGSGKSLSEKTADAGTFQQYITSLVTYSQSNTIAASNGTAGYQMRSSTSKILVGPDGVEYGQVILKGMMGSLFMKQAMDILAHIPLDDNNTTVAGQGTAMQHNWDMAFGYLAIPADYDSSKTYTSADVNRPLLWGGYLAERGKPIQAGGKLFEAFRKGRAAIAAKDYAVRDAAIKTIQDTWEELAAIAALNYVTVPQSSSSIGNLGTQFHALSEGYGFILALKYRSASSKLTDANYQRLVQIISTNFYTLVDEPNFAKLNEAKTILQTTYGF
jgi:hypothetical protein